MFIALLLLQYAEIFFVRFTQNTKFQMKKGIKPRYVKPQRKPKPSISTKVFRQVMIVVISLILIAGIIQAFLHLVNNHFEP